MMKMNIKKSKKKCFICNNRFSYDNDSKKFKNYKKVRDHCRYTGKYRGAAHSICNLQYKTTKKIPVVFHNDSNYDWHLIIKELGKEFDCGEFKCLGENTEKYISFSIPIKKKHKDGRIEIFEIQFIDSLRFLPTALSNLADNLSEIYKKTCPHCKNKKIENPDFEYCFVELINYDKLVYKCGECKNEC